MTPQRHAQIGALFAAALSFESPTERAAFLAEVTATDPQLRQEVEELLAFHSDTDTFLKPSPTPSTPTFLGPYQVLSTLGEGGMGAVYRVRHTEIPGPELALKLIRPGQESQQILSRFRAEQRLLRRLQHPNIARILDANTSAQGMPFFVMELVEGQPLTAYCTTHQLDIPARLQLLITTCEAVHYAHLRGVLHRDLKPSNILITAQGFPKIIDFGLAKAIGGDGDFSTVTQLGTILGTFQYMSPEQAKPTDAAITEAADIFSLGAILYELLAGHPPLSSESLRHLPYPAILERVLQEVPPPPTTEFPALNEITLRALHKDPAARYANAAELAQCLSHCLSRGAGS